MAKLIVVDGPDMGTEFELEEGGKPLTVGRDSNVELPIRDGAVSRRHFRLEFSQRGWLIVDLGSRNQTFVNGSPVKEAALKHGDLVRAGDSELRFDSPGFAVKPTGIVSTIIKEVPAALTADPIASRLERMEQALDGIEEGEEWARVRDRIEVYSEVASASSPLGLLQRLLEEVLPAVGGDSGVVISKERNEWLARASASSTPAPADEGARVHVSMSVIDKVAEEGKAILSANTRSDERFRDKESIIGKEIVSAIAAPIALEGQGTGVLYVDRRGTKPPFTEKDLRVVTLAAGPIGRWLDRLVAEEDLRGENRNLFRSLTHTKKIIGRSRAMEQALEFIRRAAPTSMTVLIQGETGTGKELVASAIHYSSHRRGRPFVAINCAALPENLVESELFGHERGAFTGAVSRRKGRFELGDTGTVFLDEVGELSLACQAKLLRLLEERQFERVGGTESVKVDVRVLAAANKSLQEAVAAGTFREDLFYRLSVLNIHLAPLRERTEDIPLLAEHFLKECGGGVKKLSPAALEKLAAYHWPGNVRQLRNVIESAVVLGSGSEIQADDLVLPEPRARRAPQGGPEAPGESDWKAMPLAEMERIHIQRVLRHTGGNKKRAAEILGIERCTLYAKLKSYGS